MRLTQRTAAAWRAEKLLEQGWYCPLCGNRIDPKDAVLDHDHSTGHCRAVLHRGCNALLGKIENSYRRYGVSLDQLHGISYSVHTYITADYSRNPIYHTHKTEDEKRLARNKKARERRASTKGAK